MKDECRYHGKSHPVRSFLLGTAIGGGLALLLAPRSGRETRELATEMTEEFRERVKGILADAEMRIRKTIDEGREAMNAKKDLVTQVVVAGKEAFEEGLGKEPKPH